MPEISRFFGIVIRMFVEAGAVHHTPHFHAYYQGQAAVFSISPVELIAGDLPKTQRRLVEAWPSCTSANCDKTGTGCKLGSLRSPLRRYNRPMTHPIYRVQAFELVGPYTIRIVFDDHTEQVVDFRPVLAGELYGPLRDPALFNQVRLDPEAGTLVWPNGADFDPAALHDWPDVCAELTSRAAAWGNALA